MKNILLIAFVLTITVFTSCRKSYVCECTDSHGVKTTDKVWATNVLDANKNCDELDIMGNCVLK